MNEQRECRATGRLIGGLIVLGMGVVFLLRNLGYVRIDDWWPLIMIVVGLSLIVSYFFKSRPD